LLYSAKNCYAINSRFRYGKILGSEVNMALPETVTKLESLLASLTKDLVKVVKGNRTAAQRVRVGTLRLEKVGKLFRKESLSVNKKPKKKTKKRKR
jgi:hypothetical protein